MVCGHITLSPERSRSNLDLVADSLSSSSFLEISSVNKNAFSCFGIVGESLEGGSIQCSSAGPVISCSNIQAVGSEVELVWTSASSSNLPLMMLRYCKKGRRRFNCNGSGSGCEGSRSGCKESRSSCKRSRSGSKEKCMSLSHQTYKLASNPQSGST